MSNSHVQEPEFPFKHRQKVQIRFNDIDLLGHVNNTVYMEFMDIAKANYFKAVLKHEWKWNAIGLVVVNINCDFCAQTFIEEPIEVLTTVTKISERSLRLEQRVINSINEEVKCVCRTIMAAFDPKTMTGAEIQPEWVEALSEYEGRKFEIPTQTV
jgi:acyl-CoA thioester hydrolase